MDDVILFGLQIIGATLAWTFKGFKGKLSAEVAGPYDFDFKFIRNIFLSVVFIFICYIIVLMIV